MHISTLEKIVKNEYKSIQFQYQSDDIVRVNDEWFSIISRYDEQSYCRIRTCLLVDAILEQVEPLREKYFVGQNIKG